MDKQALESLAPLEKKAALVAFDTAEKMCTYFQSLAKKGTREGIPEPVFTTEEKKTHSAIKAFAASFLAAEETSWPKKAALKTFVLFNRLAARETGRESGAMAYKLFMATQMNFYRDNPDLVAVFGVETKNDGNKIIEKVARFNAGIGKTLAPVDDYYNDAYQSFTQWAPELVAKLR